jgi:uncharacterized protein YcnI
MRTKALIAAAVVAALAVVGTAAAHVYPESETAPAGQISEVALVVPHGCDGSTTTSLAVRIPAGVNYVKPRVKAGWRVAITNGKLPKPVKAPFEDKTLTTGVVQVSWSGGRIPDSSYDTFGLLVGTPNTPGKTIYFPSVQRCAKGVTRWIQIPKAGQAEPEHPAPGVKLVKASGGHG